MPDEDDSSRPDGEVPTGPASTPIDHPFFLPALLGGMAIWFGYDGWFNDEIKAVTFNRVGFAVLLPLFLWFAYKARKEQQESENEKRKATGQPPYSD